MICHFRILYLLIDQTQLKGWIQLWCKDYYTNLAYFRISAETVTKLQLPWKAKFNQNDYNSMLEAELGIRILSKALIQNDISHQLLDKPPEKMNAKDFADPWLIYRTVTTSWNGNISTALDNRQHRLISVFPCLNLLKCSFCVYTYTSPVIAEY